MVLNNSSRRRYSCHIDITNSNGTVKQFSEELEKNAFEALLGRYLLRYGPPVDSGEYKGLRYFHFSSEDQDGFNEAEVYYKVMQETLPAVVTVNHLIPTNKDVHPVIQALVDAGALIAS